MNNFRCAILFISVLFLQGCGTYFNQPFTQTPARQGEFSKSTENLLDLPEAKLPVEVAVYNFRDQTGQYKAIQNGSTFSTAITQGGTAILLKALEDSDWFIPIERENLSNLSTERNIIRNTKQEYIKNLNPNEPPLPPLKYAGIILEGGVISYDTNIVTGGIGARYFGLGGSAKYRQDRITVYLRMISTSNGEILKTVYVSKTILSQALDASFFRFVKFQRLMEAETGITQNEPIELAVKDAIEKAVRSLIIEGVEDGFWSAKGGSEINTTLVNTYKEEKALEQSTLLYDRLYKKNETPSSLAFSAGMNLVNADYSTKRPGFYFRGDYDYNFGSFFGLNLSGGYFQINNGNQFKNEFVNLDLNGTFSLLPNDNFGPYFYGGIGGIYNIKEEDISDSFSTTFLKLQYGLGLEYRLNEKIGIKIFGEHNLVLSDQLDQIENGKRDDQYFNFGLGAKFYFGSGKSTKTPLKTVLDEN